MKKIDWDKPILGGDGKERSREDIEKFFIKEVEPLILAKLNSLKSTFIDNTDPFFTYLEKLIDELKDILIAKPRELERKVKEFDRTIRYFGRARKTNDEISDYRRNLLEAFDYKRFRTCFLNRLAVLLNIKTCLYCNQQYTIAIGNSAASEEKGFLKNSMAFLQFDHFFGKTQYPVLSMSLYNLIPSCPICNQRKGKGRLSLLLHPYENDLSSLIRFRIKDRAAFTNPINRRLDFLEVEIDASGNKEVDRFVNKMALAKRYARHLDIVEEIDAAIYMEPYYRKFLNDMLPSFSESNEWNVSDKILQRLIKGFYDNPEDINRRPLTKFSQDIASQLREWHYR